MRQIESSIEVTALDATLGASINGVELAHLTESQWGVVETAFHEYALLVFPAQHLTDDEQEAFASRFGEIEQIISSGKTVNISNNPDEIPDADHFARLQYLKKGNEEWHTDSSYMPVSSRASVLSAHVVTAAGGGTEWADMRAAYDDLEASVKDRIADLAAHHSLYQSQARIGHEVQPGSSYGFHDEGAPLRPLVKTHPVTGRPALFMGRHAFAVAGMTDAESEALLADLHDHACRPPFVYRHRWAPGDVVVWDNRCVLHRACPYDPAEPRSLHHTRVAGDPLTEGAPTSDTVR